jgi:hypothetical protein
MIYDILYTSNNEQRTMEWVVPEGWSPTAIAQAFEQQYPSAEVLNLEPRD